jgi:extracellular factor (EF) 3-hydroxypalmitic acid methyl ester biosynthesis protein
VHLQRPFDPVITFRNSQGEAARGTLTSLQRRALVMEIYNPYSIVQVSEVLTDLTIRSGERNIYKGKAVVVSLLNTGLMAVVSVALIDEWNDLQLIYGDHTKVGLESERFVDDWLDRFRIKHGYIVAVSEIRAYLAEVARWIDQADLSSSLPKGKDDRVDSATFRMLSKPIVATAAKYFAALEREIVDIADEAVPVYHAFAQSALHPLLLRAPFVYRTFAKPLGYAGDYEMVNQILGDSQQGPTTYFQIVNSLFLASPVAHAHRNRIDILVDLLSQTAELAQTSGRVFRVLDIGCGPAVEIERLLGSDVRAELLDITLLDFSEATLEATEKKLTAINDMRAKSASLHYLNESVHNLLKRATRQSDTSQADQYDFVYCAGLFDYLSDKVCARLLEYLKLQTRAGGRILVTNVHPSNQQRGVMEHVLEWHLIYRDEAQLESILPSHRCNERIYTDATGVNVFAEFFVPLNDQKVPV